MAGADRQTFLKTLVGFLAVSARKMLFPLKLILRFPDRLTIKTASAFTRAGQIRCTVRLQSAPSILRNQRLAGAKIQFINDAAAFALGEMAFGQATQAGRALFVAVGTGCGSAFGVNGFLAEEGTPGVPPNGYFYNAPFRDSCVDDYISRRGLEKLSGEMLGCRWMVVRLLNASPPGTNGPKPVSGALVNSCAMHCSRRSKHSVRTRSAWGDRLWQARHYFCTRWKNFVQTRRLLYILHRILLCGLCRG